jgi:thymidylate synthase
MQQYLDLVARVMTHGSQKMSRQGEKTLSTFAETIRVDLMHGFPLLTTRKLNWTGIRHEFLWYLSGVRHVRGLRQHLKIWDPFMDAAGYIDSPYGYMWRKWFRDDDGNVIDQLRWAINLLKEDPNTRRAVITAWDPRNVMSSNLPPCHYTFAFNIQKGKVCCHVSQRSADIALGVPWDLAEYALLTNLVALELGRMPGELVMTFIDAHIYFQHCDGLKEMLDRSPRKLPRLMLKPGLTIDNVQLDDLVLEGYDPHPAINIFHMFA